ncbi:MAG: 16S rRNA (cytosine(1402)-N(4))-methyltransferase [Candidatus Woykebacteria bacterium RBG_13_40_7b]|uniref:Ribosomal RNA small subunit methyltransferase H n=1 Tax=Candidatus Woykebacteria bacterium RBG_13_40_7b TaxID=1802594 RepID=A0A1G1WBU8_9BACT|nr:MAG: 16S rRNA (cytosine(1402)-N(4))-methyltransferase [Candidatus Woykebacteria bacterium RBG_13_40_7b]
MANVVFHKSVLLKEVLEVLDPKPNKKYIDATIGGGGHTQGILEKGGVVLGIDLDPEAIEYCQKGLISYLEEKKLLLSQGNFTDLAKIASRLGYERVSGILFDLGVSSHQIEKAERGFSYLRDTTLDMRMDPKLKVTAADLVNALNEGELYELFTRLGEEPYARRLARAISKSRINKQIKKSSELIEIIQKNSPGYGRVHPSIPRVFQALRIAVNDELNNLKIGLIESLGLLEKGGKLVVISFHSLEDRIVKNFFKGKAEEERIEIMTKKPILASVEELNLNPRARSAKMRVAKII